MKYDKEQKLFLTDVRELVTTARRSLSPIPVFDSEEPDISEASAAALKRAGVDRVKKTEHFLDFTLGEDSFRLRAEIMPNDGGIATVYEIYGRPDKPRREDAAEARGEAYISAYIFALEMKYSLVKIKIIYVNARDGSHAESIESVELAVLEKFFNKCKGALIAYARPEMERVTVRLPSLARLKFPYPEMRAGQREFISAVYRAAARGTGLYAQAPTGTGKTVSALYPALLALGRKKTEKIFYLTPKNTTAIAAKECLELCAEGGAVIKAISLSSKEKLCPVGLVCRDDKKLCDRYTSGKLAEATLALYDMNATVITDAQILQTAKEYTVCPHELALSYSELADVVIGDINYLFSPEAYIRRFFTSLGNYTFLVDEAHNLPERAREMYSAELTEEEIVAPFLDGVLPISSYVRELSSSLAKRFFDTLYPFLKDEILKDDNGNAIGATHLSEIPPQLYEPFEEMAAALENEIHGEMISRAEDKAVRLRYLFEYRRKIQKYIDTMYAFDTHYEMFLFAENERIRTKLYCIDPEDRIRERLSHGRGAVFFSGTLSPIHYYRSTLGGDGSSETLEVDSPFDRGQLSVSIMDKVSTRFSEREDTLLAVTRIIAATVSARRGNYMIFTPSFAYAEALSKVFRAKYPKLHTIVQRKNMSATEKRDFLAEFSKDDKSYLIAFCVMGGIYSEGIDLAGDSLIGAVIVGIGLPQLSYEREAIAAYYQEKYEEGKEFAYIYPGINRVLQAAGRVIRREDDRGVIVLIDDRFDDPIYKKLIPKLWSGMKFIPSAQELRSELDKFWAELP